VDADLSERGRREVRLNRHLAAVTVTLILILMMMVMMMMITMIPVVMAGKEGSENRLDVLKLYSRRQEKR
jgi:hypothetical protein